MDEGSPRHGGYAHVRLLSCFIDFEAPLRAGAVL